MIQKKIEIKTKSDFVILPHFNHVFSYIFPKFDVNTKKGSHLLFMAKAVQSQKLKRIFINID